MHSSLNAFLLNDQLRAFHCVYEGREKETPMTFKSFDDTIKKDDLVVVPTDTRVGFTVVKVVDVDVEVNFQSNMEVKWIVDKVDVAKYDTTIKEEENALKHIRAAEFAAQKRELAEKMKLSEDERKTLLSAPKDETKVAE